MSDLNNFRKLVQKKFREDLSRNILSIRKKVFEKNDYIENNKRHILYEQNDQTNNQPLDNEEIRTSFENFFVSLASIIKFKTKIPQTTELKNSQNITNQTINEMVNSALNNSINSNNFIDLIKKKIPAFLDSVRNESQKIFDDIQKQEQEKQKEQQKNQNNQQNKTVESYEKVNKNVKIIIQERDDPITVSSLRNMLKLTSQDKIADIVSKLSKEDFEKFIDGLQKSSLDAITQAIEKNTEDSAPLDNNQDQNQQEETGSGGQQENQPESREEMPPKKTGGGPGNLKLSEL